MTRDEIAHPVDDCPLIRLFSIRKRYLKPDYPSLFLRVEWKLQGSDDALEFPNRRYHLAVQPLRYPAVDLDISSFKERYPVGALDALGKPEFMPEASDRARRIPDR